MQSGAKLDTVFPGITSVTFVSDGDGPTISLRISKKEGAPVSTVPEGTPNAGVVAVKRVDELGFYNLGHRELGAKVGLNHSKTTAAVALLDLKNDPDCYKEFKIGAVRHQRYSQTAISRIQQLLERKSPEEIWASYKEMTAHTSVGAPRDPVRK